MNLEDHELEISYPTEWGYRVIGRNEGELRLAITEVMEGREFELELSKLSSKGNYCSLNVSLVVTDEADRKGLFRTLSDHPAIRIVL